MPVEIPIDSSFLSWKAVFLFSRPFLFSEHWILWFNFFFLSFFFFFNLVFLSWIYQHPISFHISKTVTYSILKSTSKHEWKTRQNLSTDFHCDRSCGSSSRNIYSKNGQLFTTFVLLSSNIRPNVNRKARDIERDRENRKVKSLLMRRWRLYWAFFFQMCVNHECAISTYTSQNKKKLTAAKCKFIPIRGKVHAYVDIPFPFFHF